MFTVSQIREIKIIITLRPHLTPVRLAENKTISTKSWRGGEEREQSVTVDGTANWFSHHGNHSQKAKTKTTALYRSLAYIYLPTPEMIFSAMFTSALFTVASKQEQPKHPSTDGWTVEV